MTLESCRARTLSLALELRVAERVADDDRSAGLEHLADDAVADGAPGLGDGLAPDVASRANPRAPAREGRLRDGRGACGGPVGGGERVVVEQDETLLGAGDLDDRVEHRFEERLDLGHRHQLLAELVELPEGRQLLVGDVELRLAHRRARARTGRMTHLLRFVEDAEGQVDVAQGHPIAVDQARPSLLLAVDEDLGLLVDLFEVEVPPIEEHLGVRLGEAFTRERDVVAQGPAHRCHRLVKHERPRRTLRREPL